MAREWEATRLCDLIEFTRDGEWGNELPIADSVAMMVVRGTDFERLRVGALQDIPRRYIECTAALRKQLCAGDVLIETAGGTKDQSTGRTALVKQDHIDRAGLRAKAEGRDPGLPQHIASLFPASFVDSELGEIPEGWEVKTIGDLAVVVGGSTPSTKESAYWQSGVHHWATPKDLSTLTVPVLLDTERTISDAGLAQISSGLLPKGTVLLSSRAPIGYLAVPEILVAVNQGFIAMKPRANVPSLFLLLWANANHDDIVARANGSTFLEISKSNFRPIPTIAPPAAIFAAFEQLGAPLHQRMVANERESRLLAALRDTLLPKLISGELRVKDVEKFVGATIEDENADG